MRLRRMMSARRWGALAIPACAATGTAILMVLAAGVPLNPAKLWAMAMPPNPPWEAFVPLIGFGAWNLAPHLVLAATLVVFGRSSRRTWVVLVAGTAVIAAGSLLTIGYAMGPGASSTSALIFLSLPVVLWVAISVLLIAVAVVAPRAGSALPTARSRRLTAPTNTG